MSPERLKTASVGIAMFISAILMGDVSRAQQVVERLPRTDGMARASYPPQDYRAPEVIGGPRHGTEAVPYNILRPGEGADGLRYGAPPMFNAPPSQLPPWEHAPGGEIGDLNGTFRGDLLGEPVPQRISDIKPGAFQKLSFVGAWMPGGGDEGLGISDLETFAVFGLPCPTIEAPLLVTPYFAVHYLDGPVAPDLPARLFDTTVQFRWLPKLPMAPWVRADLAIEPGVHSDFESSDTDAFRLPGHGLAIMEWTPTRKIVLGLLYLDREDVEILPAGGLILSPNDDVQLDLVFPKPKMAYRFRADTRVEWWNYVAAEFGGGPYSIRRTSPGAPEQDVIIWRDYRLYYGLERKMAGGLNSRFEVGYVFGRRIEFIHGGDADFEPDGTLLLRAGVSY